LIINLEAGNRCCAYIDELPHGHATYEDFKAAYTRIFLKIAELERKWRV
jgi:hypothetical protein